MASRADTTERIEAAIAALHGVATIPEIRTITGIGYQTIQRALLELGYHSVAKSYPTLYSKTGAVISPPRRIELPYQDMTTVENVRVFTANVLRDALEQVELGEFPSSQTHTLANLMVELETRHAQVLK